MGLSSNCSFVDFLMSGVWNAYIFSIYFFPVYIIIPFIAYFIVKYIRVRKESNNAIPPVNAPNSKKKIVIVNIILIVVFFSLTLLHIFFRQNY